MMFVFDSGGASHPEGFGAWRVHVNGHRAEFAHTVRDDLTTYPAAILTEEEFASLWRLIDRADQAEPTSRGAVGAKPAPGQPLMTVSFTRGATTRQLPAAGISAGTQEGMGELLRFVTDLIHRHTGQRAVIG